jgi:hypothetical protein
MSNVKLKAKVSNRPGNTIMKFIEITGRQLRGIVNDGEFTLADLSAAAISDDTILRVNEQGDLEVRRRDRWDIVGGLLGNYETRLQKITGLDYV